jgi:transcriptional regulator with XRE-family HTH domain
MPDTRLANFAKRLRRLMTQANLSPRDLAHAANTAEATVYRHLSGDRDEPRADTIRAYARALGVSADELLGIEPPLNLNEVHGKVPLGPLVNLRVLRSPADLRGDDSVAMMAVPEILLPAELAHESLVVVPVSDDLLSPELHALDLTIVALDHTWADADLIAVALDAETVGIRRGYHSEGEVLAVTGDPRETRRLAADAVLGRVMRIVHSV